jgi:hypothetical protein
MLFGEAPKQRWTPLHTQIIRMYWMARPISEIADQFAVSESMVRSTINSERGQEIITQLESHTFDTMLEVMTMAQAVAPEMFAEKIKLALYSVDERVRSRNTTDLLAIAGHTPIHRVQIDRPDPILDKFKDKTPQMLRDELLKLKDSANPNGVGPDEKLLN